MGRLRGRIVASLALVFASILPAAERAAAPSAHPRTVLLVHGFKDTGRKLESMARYLRERGWNARTVTVSPSWGQLGVDDLARQLAAFIDREIPAGERFDLVGFSMGGLVCRSYLQHLGGYKRVDRLVTISTPHHGTWTAYLLNNVGSRQMRPRSAFLGSLNAKTEALRHVRLTSIWTPLDLMILPSHSSRLPNARDIRIWMPAHPLMVYAPVCCRAVAEALRAE